MTGKHYKYSGYYAACILRRLRVLHLICTLYRLIARIIIGAPDAHANLRIDNDDYIPYIGVHYETKNVFV